MDDFRDKNYMEIICDESVDGFDWIGLPKFAPRALFSTLGW